MNPEYSESYAVYALAAWVFCCAAFAAGSPALACIMLAGCFCTMIACGIQRPWLSRQPRSLISRRRRKLSAL